MLYKLPGYPSDHDYDVCVVTITSAELQVELWLSW